MTVQKPGPAGDHGNYVRFTTKINGYLRSWGELCENKECNLILNVDDGSDYELVYSGNADGLDRAIYRCYMDAPDNYPAWWKRPCLEELYDGKHNLNLHLAYGGKEIVAWKFFDFDNEFEGYQPVQVVP
jgi:hypothetical protein